MEVCKKTHRYIDRLEKLKDSQGGAGRHKCAGCAYEQGRSDALANLPKFLKLEELKNSQAGTGRHKSVDDAYELGYADGMKESFS